VNDAPGAELDLGRARLMLEMAQIAVRDRPEDIFLPDGWDLLYAFRADGAPLPRARGFFAAGSPDGPGTARVVVLALGLCWGEYLEWTQNPGGEVALAVLPPGVADAAPAGVRFDAGLGKAYGILRGPLWKHLALALSQGNGTLWITAMNLAGPLANLAALDLRPGNKGPQGEQPPAAVAPCWTFSTPAAGNAAFKTLADASGGPVTNVWAGTAQVPVDFFPSAPDEAQGYARPGTTVRLPLDIADPNDPGEPWTERGGPFYLRALKGSPEGLPTPGMVVDPPAGFEQTRAHTLALLTLAAYQRRQHPGGTIIDVRPFQHQADVASGGVPWCSLFASSDTVVAAFHGTVSADELARATADSRAVHADFLATRAARVHAGALRLYTAPTSGTAGAPTFRAALAAWLKANAAGRPIYLAGHDLGGTLAQLAALDLRTAASDLKVVKVYTYGAFPLGNYDFGQLYAAKLGGDSYLVARDLDFARTLQFPEAYFPLPATVRLRGAPADDDASRHSLAAYAALLKAAQPRRVDEPRAAADSAEAAPPPLGATERAWLEARLTALGIDPALRRLGAPAAGADGWIVLSATGESALPPLAPRGGGAPVYAAEVLHVPAGGTLAVRAAGGEPPRVVAGRLVLEPRARFRMDAPGEIHAARAELGDGSAFTLVGREGDAGWAGLSGAEGEMSLGRLQPDGGKGEPGGPGDDGQPGGGLIALEHVEGTVVVQAGGGAGGAGGPGGRGGDGWPGVKDARGGNGGRGGDGGPGGNGGPGGTAVVDVGLVPSAAIQLIPILSARGAGGGAGSGGTGGHEADKYHQGSDGKPGEPGKDGGPGDLPVFVVRYRSE